MVTVWLAILGIMIGAPADIADVTPPEAEIEHNASGVDDPSGPWP